MAMTPDADDSKVASHTLAYLRLPDKKIDVVIDAFQRQGERLARVERDQGETRVDLGQVRRDIVEVKGDIALLDNKLVSAQTDILGMKGDVAEILAILHRLDPGADGSRSGE